MTSPLTNVRHFTQFKKNVYNDALAILEESNPEYVRYIQAHLQDPDPASVVNRKPTKALPKKCQAVLEALVSYELEMEQVKMSLKFLSMRCLLPNTVCSQGQWAIFHVDTWMNLAYSWQEKLELLVKRVCRWKKLDPKLYDEIMGELKPLRAKFNVVRDKYVHETGAVPGISEGPGWEFAVALDMDVATRSYIRLHEYAVVKQQGWHNLLLAATAKQLGNLEAFFERLNKMVFPS